MDVPFERYSLIFRTCFLFHLSVRGQYFSSFVRDFGGPFIASIGGTHRYGTYDLLPINVHALRTYGRKRRSTYVLSGNSTLRRFFGVACSQESLSPSRSPHTHVDTGKHAKTNSTPFQRMSEKTAATTDLPTSLHYIHNPLLFPLLLELKRESTAQ